MPELDEAAILRRAKELCERDGNLWEAEARSYQFGAPMRGRILDDTDRADYLARARQELKQERGNA